jgi:hypothetical protein
MNEADLKRALIRSIRAQGGQGERQEDRYRIGVPDMLMKPEHSPGFRIEAKIIRGAKLVATPSQMRALELWWDPPWFYTAVVGFSPKLNALYIGHAETPLKQCRYVPRPSNFNSGDWWITELLGKWRSDNQSPSGVVRTTLQETPHAPRIPRFRRRPPDGPTVDPVHPHATAPAADPAQANRPRNVRDHPPRT